MDSMRSLNTSLPTSSLSTTTTATSRRPKDTPSITTLPARQPLPQTNTPYPPAGLHAAFKAAAFSVTQLYKAAAADEDAARSAGYQAAIDELLAFLDQENLGLGDGEGWRVRQWATLRLTPEVYASGSDSEDEGVPIPAAAAADYGRENERAGAGEDAGNVMASEAAEKEEEGEGRRMDSFTVPVRPQDIFHFTANKTTNNNQPSQQSQQSNEMDISSTPKPSRGLNRHSGARTSVLTNRGGSWERLGTTTSLGPLGSVAGGKRRSPSHTDFDFANFANYGGGQQGVIGTAKRRRRGE